MADTSTDARDGGPSEPEPEVAVPAPTNLRLLMLVLLAPLFMALVSVSVINIALTPIGHALDADSSGLQWVLSGYALAFGVLLVPAGRIGDATGRKRMLLIGIAIFTIGSLLSGLAVNVGMLNGARILQGIGSGLLNPQVVGLIQLNFRGQARARAFAMFGTTVALATAVGPVLGGLLIAALGEDVGWRWVFLMNIPIGVASLLVGLRAIPNDSLRRQDRGRVDLDPVGTVLLASAILAFMLPFLERGAAGVVWLFLPVAIGLLLVWIWWEDRYRDRGREPMVDLAIFRNRGFSNGIVIVSVYFLGSTSIWIVTPMFLQMDMGKTALVAALVGLPSSALAAISSQIGGKFVLRLGRRLVIGGFVIALVSIVTTSLVAVGVDAGVFAVWALAIPLSLIGLSQGLTISPNQTLTLNAVDAEHGGVAGGILQTGQRLGQAVGTAVIPGIVFTLLGTGAPWIEAYVAAMAVIATVCMIALGVSIVDRRREVREEVDTRGDGPLAE